MKQPAFYNRLSELAYASICNEELGASGKKISVQADRVVVQLYFDSLQRPFDERAILSIVEEVKTQLLTVAFAHVEFAELGFSLNDSTRLWVFIAESYGMGSYPVCNFSNGQIEWTIPHD